MLMLFPKEGLNKTARILDLYFCLDIRLPPAQGSDLGDPTDGECSLVLGKLNVTHGFPMIYLVSTE